MLFSSTKIENKMQNVSKPPHGGLGADEDYYPFGMIEPGRQYEILGDSAYRFGFNGKEHDDNIYGKDNSYDYGMRFYDPRLGRFMSIDPIAKKYVWNSSYAYAEDRVIDGTDLEGKEWENFMSKFKNPGELAIKVPNEKTAQSQHYQVTVQNPKMSFADFKSEFKSSPQTILSNPEAKFDAPVDKEGNPSQFKEGSYIKVELKVGVMNNGYVLVKSLNENKDGSLSATFVTLEGHVEKGIINFTISQDKNGNTVSDIKSKSDVDYGMVPNEYARSKQVTSWKEVLNNVTKKLDGKVVGEKVEINNPPKTEKKKNDN